ncbi:MAG TPA: glycosyltransferase [Nocardioides sp.]|uniref:glycosyltransferase family 4 protein n=1 Tax=Nocardioides sp. TaxID=35761 RepID=UPI002F410212
MRVLVAHNRYRSAAPSGENRLVDAEIALLRDGGVEVVEMITESDDIAPGLRGALQAAPGPVYSPSGVRRFRRLLEESRPDVVHLHNVFPLISPYVVRVAGRAGVPVVQTVHNYRHGCVNGLHLRDGHPCTDCLGTRFGLPAVRHGCYRGSRLQTLPMTAGQNFHRSTWREGISRYLALTPFARDKLVATGVPAERVTVRPTWVPDPGHDPEPGNDVLFVGRLDQAKGVDRLLEAWASGGRRSGRRLRIAGDGPLAAAVAAAAAADDSIEHLGPLDPAGVHEAMRLAAYVVVASRVYEAYPLVVAEAFGTGRPVLTVDGGSVGSVVGGEGGWTVAPTTRAIADAIRSIDDHDVARQSVVARARFERDNTPARGLESLLEVYGEVMR